MEQSPEKLTVIHLVKKLPAFYGTRKLVTVITGAIHSIPFRPISL